MKGPVPDMSGNFETKKTINSSSSISPIVLPRYQMLQGEDAVLIMMILKEPIVRRLGGAMGKEAMQKYSWYEHQ